MKVTVVGGGFAGLAAAIALQEGRHEVTLLERRGVLGGRATSFPDATGGEDVDNGTHLMIGAYRDTLDLIRRAGASDLLLEQDHLHIDYRDERGWSSLDCPPLPAPLHLVAGLLRLRIPWRARLDTLRFGLGARFGRRPEGLTLAEWMDRLGQGADARRLVWDPLATAILNETAERASAVLFHDVFKAAFLETADASRLVFLRRGYGRLLDRLGAYLEARGGRVVRRARATAITTDSGRATGVEYAMRPTERADIVRGEPARDARVEADAVVSAVPWSALGPLLPEGVRGQEPFASAARLTGSPIVSIEMWLDRVVVDRVMAGLRDSEIEWVFDKGRLYGRAGAPQHLAFIVSAARRSLPRPNAELAAAAEAALRRYFPEMAGASVLRTLVLREAEATFSCDPASERLRPGPETPIRGLVLAGDWTDTGLPATIEGAVRSGLRAARVARVSPHPFPALRWAGLAWLAVWAPAYWLFYGPVVFLNLCDIAVILTCAGLWRGSALLLSTQAVSSLVVDAAWTLDLAWRAATGRHLIGGTEYMWDPAYPGWVRALSLFHVLLPVTLLYALRRVGYDRRALALQSALAAAVLIASRAFGPAANVNFAFTDPVLGRSWEPAPVHLAVILGGLVSIYAATAFVLGRWLRRTSPAAAG